MNCPNCDATFETIGYEGVKIETCPRCEGQWLDAGELRHIVAVREVRFDPEECKAVDAAARIPAEPLEQPPRDLPCPKCGALTHPLNYGGDTGIVIDKCRACGGVWLDGGELERIQMLVERWEDGLPDLLAKHGPRLRRIETEVDERTRAKVSRFGFVNTIINGILNVFD